MNNQSNNSITIFGITIQRQLLLYGFFVGVIIGGVASFIVLLSL